MLSAVQTDAPSTIQFAGSSVLVSDLEIPRRDVVDYLESLPEAERVAALISAVEVGVFCLERARSTRDTEFVRRHLETFVGDVDRAATRIPSAIEAALSAKIGMGEGQVLEPVDRLVKAVSATVAEKLNEVKDLFTKELDPARETGALGSALRTVRDRLDPAREDSIQGAVRNAVQAVAGGDGAIAKAVREVVADAVKPLKEEVDALGKEIRGQEAAREALEQTTQKGVTYEALVVEELQSWAKLAGFEIEHVGVDNRPGDVLIAITASSLVGDPLRIVVEARDRQKPLGRKAIGDTMVEAIREREADCGIYVSASRSGLGVDIGDFAEGQTEAGAFVACTHENLRIALRLLIVQARLDRASSDLAEINLGLLVDQIGRVRTALERIKTINRRATDVRSGADGIEEEARALRDEIRDALSKMDDALRAAAGAGLAS
jgi:predicted  nucleic acid-binding Zn-ribbon protein